MRETMSIKPGRGCRRRARRLALRHRGVDIQVQSRAGHITYSALVNEASRLSAWIYEEPASMRDDRWLRPCHFGRYWLKR